jgi:D-alanyl-D-alanine dipeptidase
MAVLRRGIAALFLVVTPAGCAAGSAPDPEPSARPSSSNASATTAGSVRPASTLPARPVASSTSASGDPGVVLRAPTVSAKARAAGLVDISGILPSAVVDLRYTTSNNFVGVPLYPGDARCLIHESMAAGLTAAAKQLSREGEVLVFWDCYRPHAVQVRMFQMVPNPDWVARPGPFATSHEAARSVDVTLAQAATNVACSAAQRVQGHCLLDMGTGFDDFSARAHAFATDGVSAQAQANRTRLRTAMNAGGITVYSGEWWHFDGPGADVQRPHLDVPVN